MPADASIFEQNIEQVRTILLADCMRASFDLMIVSDEVLARSLTLIARDLFSDLVIQLVEDNYYRIMR